MTGPDVPAPPGPSGSSFELTLPVWLVAGRKQVVLVEAAAAGIRVGMNLIRVQDLVGALTVSSGEGFDSPQLMVIQTTRNEFARIRLRSGPRYDPIDNVESPFPDWDVVAGGGHMSLFVSGRNVLNCLDNGRVGVLTETPRSELDVAGTATVQVLDITGGADVAERFRLCDGAEAEPGTVLVIADDHETLAPSVQPFDSRVAGVVSGDRGLPPAVTLAAAGSSAGWVPVALAGRVRCLAEATTRPIRPGDRLTTSTVAGHAMACPPDRHKPGAVLGKALTGLADGLSSVVALVSLQ